MNKELQRIKIAEACGWKLTKIKSEFRFAAKSPTGELTHHDFGDLSALPAYTDCLNACADMEKAIEDRMDEYLYMLVNVVKGRDLKIFRFSDRMLTESYFRELVCATASQRCEAFLKTLSLWTPTGEENE